MQRVLEHKVLLMLGDISLTTYMIDIPLQVAILLVFAFFHYAIPYNSLWFFLCYAASGIGGGLAVHTYYERT